MASSTNARTSMICSEVVYSKKTQCNEDQMRNHTGNFHIKQKLYQHQRSAPAKCGFGPHWNEEVNTGHHGLREEEPNISSLPSSVECGSRSQLQTKCPLGQLSRAHSHCTSTRRHCKAMTASDLME